MKLMLFLGSSLVALSVPARLARLTAACRTGDQTTTSTTGVEARGGMAGNARPCRHADRYLASPIPFGTSPISDKAACREGTLLASSRQLPSRRYG